jgi:hypothetical protein
MSKELFTSERERVLIESIRSQEQTFYNRQSELNEIQLRPNEQLSTRL